MGLLKILKRVVRLVRGGASPVQIGLGAFLGMLIGLVPGFNLIVLLAIGALVVLNAHIGVAIIGIALGKLFALILAPVSFRMGYWIIHETGFESIFARMVNAPLLALGGLERYCTTGALPFALLFGGLYAYLIIRGVGLLRTAFYSGEEPRALVKKITSPKPVALVIKLLFGKKQEFLAPRPVIRKSGLAALGIMVLALAGLDLFVLGAVAGRGTRAALERINGAEVNIERTALSVLRGRLELQGLELTDPDNPDYNRFQTEKITADLSIRDLLARRIVVNEMRLQGVQTGVARRETGKVYEKPPVPDPEPVDPEEPEAFDYFKNTERIERFVRRAVDYLEKQRENSEERQEQQEDPRRYVFETAEVEGYMKASALELLRDYPALTVRHAVVGDMSFFGPLAGYKMVISNVSSSPAILQKATDIEVLPASVVQQEQVISARLNLHRTELPHELEMDLSGISVGSGTAFDLSDEAPVNLYGGSARLRTGGVFSADDMDLPFIINISGLSMEAEEGESIAGLDPQVAETVFSALKSLELHGRLYGRPAGPRISVDTSKMAEALKKGLLDAGVEGARKLLEDQDVDIDGLSGLLRDGLKSGDDEEEEDSEADDREKLEDTIRSLF